MREDYQAGVDDLDFNLHMSVGMINPFSLSDL